MNDARQSAIEAIAECLREANSHFMNSVYRAPPDNDPDDNYGVAEYYVEKSFVELLVLSEHLGLHGTYQSIDALFKTAKKDGFLQSEMGPEEPYLIWCSRLRMYLDAIAEASGLGETSASELQDLKGVLRRAVYVICDTTLFPHPPKNEAEVHDRLEGILKCHFGDLKRKPSLTKPIKNFEPDSGIPSSKTLIEYKFVSTKAEARIVVDQILADTHGYHSPHWRNLLFVIYETSKVFPEEEWKNLLKQCGLGGNYDAIVLSGDAIPSTAVRTPKKSGK